MNLNYITNLLNSQKFHKWVMGAFAFSLFFPIRYVFHTHFSYLTGQYSDFTSISLYLSDILLILLLSLFGFYYFSLNKPNLFIIPRGKNFLMILIFVFWLILGLFYHRYQISGLNMYYFIKWLEVCCVAYGTMLFASNYLKALFIKLYVIFSTLQAFLALLQFKLQHSIGLFRLGESHISPQTYDVAKLVVNGKTFIRAYGTFPHPNVLAAFLVTGILLTLWLCLSVQGKRMYFYNFCLFLQILGFVSTFSRGGYIAVAVGLGITCGFVVLKYLQGSLNAKKAHILALFTIFISITLSTGIFKNFLFSRATVGDKAVTERLEYNKIALKQIQGTNLWGLGIGESLLHMEQYSPRLLASWEIQPIHNYYLLSAADLGIPGAILLILIFLTAVHCQIINIKTVITYQNKLLNTVFLSVLCSFFVLMLFDHYFYTLEQTQLLLWLILGFTTTADSGFIQKILLLTTKI